MSFASDSHCPCLSVYLGFQLSSCAAPLLSKLGELHAIRVDLRRRITHKRDLNFSFGIVIVEEMSPFDMLSGMVREMTGMAKHIQVEEAPFFHSET